MALPLNLNLEVAEPTVSGEFKVQEIISLFLEHGFTPGRKTHTVTVPHSVLHSTAEIKNTFIRGLFGTDGCLRFDRLKNKTEHTFPRIEFSFASASLRDSLKLMLDELGYKNFVWMNTVYYSICIPGKNSVEKWMTEIKPNNPKHLKKYHFWKENGFYPGNTH